MHEVYESGPSLACLVLARPAWSYFGPGLALWPYFGPSLVLASA